MEQSLKKEPYLYHRMRIIKFKFIQTLEEKDYKSGHLTALCRMLPRLMLPFLLESNNCDLMLNMYKDDLPCSFFFYTIKPRTYIIDQQEINIFMYLGIRKEEKGKIEQYPIYVKKLVVTDLSRGDADDIIIFILYMIVGDDLYRYKEYKLSSDGKRREVRTFWNFPKIITEEDMNVFVSDMGIRYDYI